jgi:DNA-binding response OmpR family regulator
MMSKICKVLIIEDNEEIREMLGALFVYEGYHFSVGADGVEMRHLLATDTFDVVILDLLLPGPDGGLILAREAAARGIGVILVTGSHSHHESIQKSGHNYLLKPYRLDSLMALIDQTLKATRAKCVKKPAYASR